MTADIITFPVTERSAGDGSVVWRGKTGEQTLATALNWDKLGLTLEDVPADTNPDLRRIIEIILAPANRRDPGGDTVA